jgi:8-amino-7-oxononanoate synthase
VSASLSGRWTKLLQDLRAAGRYRDLQGPAGIDFVSNDYLGYGRELHADAPSDLPHSGTASRLLRGNHPVWEQVEGDLARWHGAETCLMMNTGYCANEGLLFTVIQPHDWVASDALNHASIVDGLRLARAERFVFRHNDLNHLETGLCSAAAARARERELFIVTESLFGMDGDRAPLAEMVSLAERYQANLIVDEAHATGCFGGEGAGCVDLEGLRPRILASVHTGGKALGVPGAYICGSQLLRELMINCCRHLIFTTALPPVAGRWWLDTLERVRRDDDRRDRLHRRAAFLRSELRRHGVEPPGQHYIVPVILGPDDRAVRTSRQLRNRGWDIRAIRPPTVAAGTSRLRISIHAVHDESTLAEVAAAVAEYLQP